MNADNLRTIAVVAAGACAALSILSAVLVRKIMTKIILVVVLGGIAVGAWVYRGDLEQCAKTCSCRLAGHEIKVPHCPTAK